jgi:hypothetical protein
VLRPSQRSTSLDKPEALMVCVQGPGNLLEARLAASIADITRGICLVKTNDYVLDSYSFTEVSKKYFVGVHGCR